MASDSPSSGSSSSSSGSHPGKPRGDPVYSVDPEDIIAAIERPKAHPDEDGFHRGILPYLDLPSFGEPDPDCGDPCPGSLYFCPSCATVHEKPHVCYRYDCRLHWAHAVRRRAAGSKSGAGICPQLDALRRYLNAYRDDNQYFHHLVISLAKHAKDRRLAASDPLERERETIREIMDEIGIQGMVGYHPAAGDNEDLKSDDRGKWKDRIGKDTEWDDVKEELEARPHWHIVGVAPFVDFSCTPEIESETGAVLHRITQEDSNISIEDNEAMCRAVTYVLSHCGIYDTDDGQRRLAAWMKGPDVGRISPLEKNKTKIQTLVYEVAKDTLGIAPPNLECDTELGPEEIELGTGDELPEVSRTVKHPLHDVWGMDDDAEEVGAHVSTTGHRVYEAPETTVSPSSSGGTGGGDSWGSSSTDLPPNRDPFESWSGSSSTTSTVGVTDPPDDVDVEDEDDDDRDDEGDTCGSRLRHISQASDYLLDREWNESHEDEDVQDVETAYRSYVTWMEAQGDDVDDPTRLPEERIASDPPPTD